MEALLLMLDVACFVLLLFAVRRRERVRSDREGDLGYFAYRRGGEDTGKRGGPHA